MWRSLLARGCGSEIKRHGGKEMGWGVNNEVRESEGTQEKGPLSRRSKKAKSRKVRGRK